MEKEVYVLVSRNTGRTLRGTTTLEGIDNFLEEEWFELEPENYLRLKSLQKKEEINIVSAVQTFGHMYDIEVKVFSEKTKESENFEEKLRLFRWVLENQSENEIYKLGWDKDLLEKELIELYTKR